MEEVHAGMVIGNRCNLRDNPLLDFSLECWEADQGNSSERVYELIYHNTV
jgi:hypothetical protein